jgi:hypothetical protein
VETKRKSPVKTSVVTCRFRPLLKFTTSVKLPDPSEGENKACKARNKVFLKELAKLQEGKAPNPFAPRDEVNRIYYVEGVKIKNGIETWYIDSYLKTLDDSETIILINYPEPMEFIVRDELPEPPVDQCCDTRTELFIKALPYGYEDQPFFVEGVENPEDRGTGKLEFWHIGT